MIGVCCERFYLVERLPPVNKRLLTIAYKVLYADNFVTHPKATRQAQIQRMVPVEYAKKTHQLPCRNL